MIDKEQNTRIIYISYCIGSFFFFLVISEIMKYDVSFPIWIGELILTLKYIPNIWILSTTLKTKTTVLWHETQPKHVYALLYLHHLSQSCSFTERTDLESNCKVFQGKGKFRNPIFSVTACSLTQECKGKRNKTINSLFVTY